MKVLFIIPHTFISGAAIQLRALLEHLPDTIERTTFVTSYDGVLGATIANRSRLISITSKTPEEKLDILKRYLTNDFDILHVIESWDGYQLLPYFKKKKIVTLYGNYHRRDQYFKKRLAVLELEKDVIKVTDNPRNLNLFKDIRYIKTGIPRPDNTYTIPRPFNSVIWVGRNSDEKRVSTLFRIAREMPDIDFTAVIAGPLPIEDTPPNLVIYHNVIRKLEMEYLYKSNSIYLNTSKHEGTPQALIEAMWCGCIPVCPNTGGIPDLIGRNGIVVNSSSRDKDERDNIQRFCNAIHTVMYETDIKGLRQAIIDSVQDYSIENMIRDWRRIYDE